MEQCQILSPDELNAYIEFNICPANISNCIEEVNKDIGDRYKFYTSLVIERLDKCNRLYLSDFDNELNELMHRVSNDDPNIDMSKLIKYSSKITSSLYDKLLLSVKNLIRSNTA
jgi:hypothetical protein